MDIELENPKFYNIREPWKGVSEREVVRDVEGSCHCIMAFQKIVKKKKLDLVKKNNEEEIK
jgi:hypothetical protein